MAEMANGLLRQHKELDFIPRNHIKKPHVRYAYNANSREAEAGGPFTDQSVY